jgi:hypothetical protein
VSDDDFRGLHQLPVEPMTLLEQELIETAVNIRRPVRPYLAGRLLRHAEWLHRQVKPPAEPIEECIAGRKPPGSGF